jgi:azurin/glucose/arabinose dehydrogenase
MTAIKSLTRLSISALALLASTRGTASEALLQFKKGDHVAIVGSGLADRQQHQAWFESLIHKAFPADQLTIRNFGFAADEITKSPRSDGVPPLEWYLAMKKGDTKVNDKLHYYAGTDFGADVVLAYWGFNESFKGPEGLEEFKQNLNAYLTKLLASNYSGEGAPRVVLFSPIAHEDLKDSNHSNGAANNVNLKLYTAAMAEVAKANRVPFVDLFRPSLTLFEKTATPLSINGIHLTEAGDKALAPIQFKAVFGTDPTSTEDPAVAKIRTAILEKNKQWHGRYRTVDQYNIYGSRGLLEYAGVSNNKILGQEMTQRDVKTANRDKLVWATAQGREFKVVDDNLPPVNLTPPNVDQAVPYMDPQEIVKHLKLPAKCKVELIASEKTFPDLINPVQMNFDTKGRLWIAAWPSYPETSPTTTVFDKILVCDLDPKTGMIAKMTTFADGLNCPTGFQFYKDGILLIQSPDLLYLRDTDGDGKADTKEHVLQGLDAADSHHETNSICYEPGGAVYLSDGVFHRTNVETVGGPVRNVDGAIYRYEPVTGKFMRHVPFNFMNPHGRVFDRWGNDLITDATGNENYFGPAFSGHLDSGQHPKFNNFWQQPSRPCAGTAILSSRHFPDDWQGLFLNTNVIGIQGIFRAKITEKDSGIVGETLEHLVTTDIAKNPNFRPSGITVAPDGSLYFMDWSQMLIGHLQHHLRDPNRDHAHGRLYRITYEGRPLLQPKKIDGQPITSLLALLTEPEDDVRLRAKIELGRHPAAEVAAATVAWVRTLDPKDAAYEHHLLEALWVHQWHNVVNLELLGRVLKSPEPRARAQAVRVIGYWRDRVPSALVMVKAAANDRAPRVRLEAVRVASFFREAAAADAALTALKHPMDYYLDYCFKETMRQLKPWWSNAAAEGKSLAMDNPAGIAFLLDSVATADLDKLPKTNITHAAMLTRPGVEMADRVNALAELTKLQKSASPVGTLVGLLKEAPVEANQGTADLCKLFLRQPAASFKSVRAALVALSATSGSETVRQTAIAAMITADASIVPASEAAKKSPQALLAFLNALPHVPDPALRGSAAPLVRNLLANSADSTAKGSSNSGIRFVRVALPRVGTLSLAEVQIFSGGKNIAPAGTASEKPTPNSSGSSRGIDNNTDGAYLHNSVTHSEEQIENPWWEVDLGSEQLVESVVIWNRTDDETGKRLEGFEVTALDAKRQEVFKKSGNPAPSVSVEIKVQDSMEKKIRLAAIRSLASLSRDTQAVFTLLTSLLKRDDQVPTVAKTMSLFPLTTWPKDQAAVTVKSIADWAKTIHAIDRNTPEYIDTVKVAQQFITLLPADQAAAATRALSGLTVVSHTLKCVREELRYDKARLVVEAGKPFQLVFENPDGMPHNVVFVTPGKIQEVALAVAAQGPEKLDTKGRAYVIEGDSRIFEATKIVAPGKSETLMIDAPAAEGTYHYVCTFPGHWSVMKGDLIVTKDVAAYLAAHPGK